MRRLLPSLLFLASSCATTQVPMPTAQQASAAAERWPGTTQEELVAGRTLFVERCSGCHTLPVPDSHTPDSWPKLIDEMADRSKLTKAERARVLHYLVAVSSPAVTAKR
ncbi:MAG: hypothetical protein ACXVEF_19890 [Polyangiales bacterium]